jgi:hypothetical protein
LEILTKLTSATADAEIVSLLMNLLSTTAEGVVVCCLGFSGNCAKSHGDYSSLAKKRILFVMKRKFVTILRPITYVFETLGSYAQQFSVTFSGTLVRTTAPLKLTRANTVPSLGVLL